MRFLRHVIGVRTIAGLSILLCSGCSPSSFFGSAQDTGVQNQTGYRQVNSQCSGIKIDHAAIDTPTFIKLIDCFNNDGGLKEISELVHKLTPEELDPFVQLSNKYILYDGKTLVEIEKSFDQMEEARLLDPLLAQVATILENEDFLYSAMGLLKELYFKRAGFLGRPTVDQELLLALQHLSTKFTADSVIATVDDGLTLASSNAFGSLLKHLNGNSPSGRSLQDIVTHVSNYMNLKVEGGHHALGREMIDHTRTGELFAALDPMLENGNGDLRTGIPRTTVFLESSLANSGIIFDGLNGLFAAMNRPINCLEGTKAIPNGDLFVMHELLRLNLHDAASFLKRTNPLLLAGTNPFCSYPPELGTLYPYLTTLADTTAIEPGVDLINHFSSAGLEHFLVDLLADNGLTQLTPMLAELRDRDALPDLFLILTLMRTEDRPSFYKSLNELIVPVGELGGKSVYDVISGAAARASPLALYRVLHSFGNYINSSTPILQPVLQDVRSAYYVNNVHPFLDVQHRLLAEAAKNEALFTSLFSIYERQDFKDAIKLIAKIARNGRLKETIRTALNLFRPFVDVPSTPIIHTNEPEFIPSRRHNLGREDLNPFTLAAEPSDGNQACRDLFFTVSMADYQNPGYDDNLNNYLACLKSGGGHVPVASSVQYLRDNKVDDGTGRTFWAYTLDLIQKMNFNTTEAGYIGDAWVAAFDDGRYARLLKATSLLTSLPVVGPNEPTRKGSRKKAAGGGVFRPLVDLAAPLVNAARVNLDRVEQYAAKILRRGDFTDLVRYVDTLSDRKPEPVPFVDQSQYPVDQIKDLLTKKECVTNSADLDRRTQEIIYDYQNAVNSWETVNGKARYRWAKQEFTDAVEPLFKKLGDPAQSDPHKPVLDAMFGVSRFFTLGDRELPDHTRHYRPDYLTQWLYEKSNDFRPISYYYPGDQSPRVRLVNSLDRLDLVLVNSDKIILTKNYALQFLQEIGESYGDEPRSVWPQEIIDKADRTGETPKTLAQTLQHIKDLLNTAGMIGVPPNQDCGSSGSSFPVSDDLKVTLFNTREVISILDENMPRACTDAEAARGECALNAAGQWEKPGLKVLRDLFYQLYYSTPPANREDSHFAQSAVACIGNIQGPCANDANNLFVILKMVRMGFMREVGRQLPHFDRHDPTLAEFFGTIIHGSIAPDVKTLTNAILRDDPTHKLLWTAIDAAFDVINAGENQDLTPFYQKQLDGKTAEEKAAIIKGWYDDLQRMKQFAFYDFAVSDQLGATEVMVHTLGPVFAQYRDYFVRHADKIENLFRSPTASYLVRALEEDTDSTRKAMVVDVLTDLLSNPQHATDVFAGLNAIDLDAHAAAAWDRFSGRKDVLSQNPQYQALKVDELVTDFKHFVEEQSPTAGGPPTAHTLRLRLADHLDAGDLDQILLLASKQPPEFDSKPNQFYGIFEALSQEIDSGNIEQLSEILRRSLTPDGRRR